MNDGGWFLCLINLKDITRSAKIREQAGSLLSNQRNQDKEQQRPRVQVRILNV
jgi:hypothetical protein